MPAGVGRGHHRAASICCATRRRQEGRAARAAARLAARSCAKSIAAASCSQKYGVVADVWSATSFNELRRDGLAARTLEPAAPDREAAHVRRSRERLERARRIRSSASTDYMKTYQRSDPAVRRRRRSWRSAPTAIGRSDYRAQAARVLRSRSPLGRARGAQRAGRRRHDRKRASSSKAIADFGLDPSTSPTR